MEALDNFKRTYTRLYDRMTDHFLQTSNRLLIVLDNGDKVLYDDYDKTCRWLPNDIHDPSEETYSIEFGKRLVSIMNHKGITQPELSRITGLSQSTLSRYITGISVPNMYNHNKIIKALHCSDDEIRYLDIL